MTNKSTLAGAARPAIHDQTRIIERKTYCIDGTARKKSFDLGLGIAGTLSYVLVLDRWLWSVRRHSRIVDASAFDFSIRHQSAPPIFQPRRPCTVLRSLAARRVRQQVHCKFHHTCICLLMCLRLPPHTRIRRPLPLTHGSRRPSDPSPSPSPSPCARICWRFRARTMMMRMTAAATLSFGFQG